MIANFFNKSKPVVLFIVILSLFIYYTTATILFEFNLFSTLYFLERLGVFCVFAAFIFLVNFIIQKNNITQNNSYALLLIVLILGTFYETMFSNLLLFSNFVLLLAFRKVYSLRSGFNTKQKLFDAGFWVGIASLIYVWSFLFIVLIYLAILIYQKLDIKNFFIPIVGVVFPVFIYFTYCFYFDNLDLFYDKWIIDPNLNFGPYNQLKFLIPIAFLLTLILWSIISLTPKIVNKGVNTKRSWRLVLNHLIISATIIFLSPVKNGSEMFFMLFPFSVIVAKFLKKSDSNNFKNVILYLIVVISIAVYFL